MFLRYSLIPSVSTPIPMAVKKLMLKRVLRGLSMGKIPANAGSRASSFILSDNFFIPIFWASSSIKILMKIREDEVVSSSFK
jgi:hypothetical protein